MARIRYLKPDFFFDEELAQLEFHERLAFAGLWCQADKRGRLEDRPTKLKALIYPYDNVDFEAVLKKLAKKPFIIRYVVDGRKYIQILNFDKHQRPHHTERDSSIPAFNRSLTVKEPLDTGETPEGMGKGMEKGMGRNTSSASPDSSKMVSLKDIKCSLSEGSKHKIYNRVVDIFGSRGWKTDEQFLKPIFAQILKDALRYNPKDPYPYVNKVVHNWINNNAEWLSKQNPVVVSDLAHQVAGAMR